MVPKKPLSIFAALLIWVLSTRQVAAQCAMCRAVLESNGDNAVAEGINNGIVYLMAIPYILVGVIIFVVYRKVKA
ncbi:MAG: hypothetical protein JSW57_08770 [Flavobacteriaceae bacterium]|jgi:hypothetical protein|nr:MAG: hypothetical protein JSW57_08770 [Flavobacteriaceae bacterium]